jgi:hypothetical protein
MVGNVGIAAAEARKSVENENSPRACERIERESTAWRNKERDPPQLPLYEQPRRFGMNPRPYRKGAES